jgi:ligand-binding sensor domain-containing protein
VNVNLARQLFAPFSARCIPLALGAVAAWFAPSARAEEWTLQEGPFGGSVIALDHGTPGTVYAQRNDTVFRTTDAGAHWVNVGPTAQSFTFLALDVTPSGQIWTGTSLRGVAWSLNGGLSWTNDQIVTNPHSGLGATIVAIGVDPQGRVFAGGYRSVNQGGSFLEMSISGMAFAFDESGEALAGTVEGVWRSADGGASWTSANAGMEEARVNALAVDGPAGIWAGTYDGEVFRSTDAGVTWTLSGPGLPGDTILALEVTGAGVLASTTGGGLFRTTNGGLSWAPAGANPGEIRDLHAVGGDLWIAATGHGVFRSGDGGVTALSASAAAMYTPLLSDLDRDAEGSLYLSSIGSGVFRSMDAGATWSSASTGLGSLVVGRIAAGEAGRVWAAAWNGIFTTTNGGDSWAITGFEGQRVREIVALPANVLLAVVDGVQALPAIHRSTDAGESWELVWSSPTTFSMDASTIAGDGSVLLGGSSFFGGIIVRSTDAGATWEEIQLGFAGVGALAADETDRVWATLDDNVVHRSTDHGVSWTPLPNGGWPTGTVGSLSAIEHGDDGLFLVATGSVFRSIDEGNSWTEFETGLPASAVVTFLQDTDSGFFAGTSSSGLFRLGGATDAAVGPIASLAPILHVAPNPFHARTTLSWNLPQPATVRVLVHDVSGRRVAELAPGAQPAGRGTFEWDGTAEGGVPVNPGTYFIRLEADGRSAGAKVLRLR